MENDAYADILSEGNANIDLTGKIVAADRLFSFASVVMQQKADDLAERGYLTAASIIEQDIQFLHATLCAIEGIGESNESNN